jgi:hypothetical protein
MASSNECPKCGHANPEGAGDCENCGITFDIFSTEQEKARREKEEAEKAATKAAEEAKYNIPCLKCGHMNSPITDDCIKCGVVFAKCYESTEQDLQEDPDKAAELAELLDLKKRHQELKAELLAKQKEEAARKEQEERERLEALRKERERQEKLRKEQEEKERLEAEKREAERKRKEEEARRAAEEEKKRQEKLRKEQEEKERLEAEKKAAEEKKRQAELEKEQEKLKKEQEEKERIEAQKALEEEKKRQSEQEQLDLERRKQEAEEQEEAIRLEKLNGLLKPKASIKKLLKTYIGESVGMNYDVPTVIKAVKLLSVNDDYLSVHAEDDETVFSYPIRNILSIAENIDGITTGGTKNKATFQMVIKVSHRMV